MTAVAHTRRPAEPDAELVARIRAGDLDALGVLFERYQHDVRRFLMRLGVSSDLDDLVQLCFLEVLNAAHNFDERCHARPWLLGIAAMMVRRQRRSFARMATRLRAWATSKEEARSETPSDTFEGRQIETRLFRALARLSPKKREVFVMIALEGASGEEAALALRVPLNTIWTRLHHARGELRQEFGKDRA
jgi:RNA polymerase sigma-70 factor (ECF subfamily)